MRVTNSSLQASKSDTCLPHSCYKVTVQREKLLIRGMILIRCVVMIRRKTTPKRSARPAYHPASAPRPLGVWRFRRRRVLRYMEGVVSCGEVRRRSLWGCRTGALMGEQQGIVLVLFIQVSGGTELETKWQLGPIPLTMNDSTPQAER